MDDVWHRREGEVNTVGQIASNPSAEWHDYMRLYRPLIERLQEEIVKLTEPKPLPAEILPLELTTQAYIHAYQLQAVSTVSTCTAMCGLCARFSS